MIQDAVVSESIKELYLRRDNKWPDVERNPVIQKSSKYKGQYAEICKSMKKSPLSPLPQSLPGLPQW